MTELCFLQMPRKDTKMKRDAFYDENKNVITSAKISKKARRKNGNASASKLQSEGEIVYFESKNQNSDRSQIFEFCLRKLRGCGWVFP